MTMQSAMHNHLVSQGSELVVPGMPDFGNHEVMAKHVLAQI